MTCRPRPGKLLAEVAWTLRGIEPVESMWLSQNRFSMSCEDDEEKTTLDILYAEQTMLMNTDE